MARQRSNLINDIRLTLRLTLVAFVSSLAWLPLGSCDAGDDVRVGKYRLQTVEDGGSSDSLRKRAVRAMPMAGLNAGQQRYVKGVIREADLFRRMPTYAFEIEPTVYDFFTQNPDAAVGMWQAMGISKFKLRQTTATRYLANAGDGTTGTVDVLYTSPNSKLISIAGQLTSPMLLRPINVTAVVHLQTAWYKNPKGEPLVSHRADMFVVFPSATVSAALKLMAPMSRSLIDKNFEEISLFGHVMSSAMATRPDWVMHYVSKMTGVPEDKVAGLERLTNRMFTRQMTGHEMKATAAPQRTPAKSVSAAKATPVTKTGRVQMATEM